MLLQLDETERSLLEEMVRDRLATFGQGQTYHRDHNWREARRTRQALAELLIQLAATANGGRAATPAADRNAA